MDEKVGFGDLLYRLNKLSMKFTETVVFTVPILKRNVTLKRVLFDLQYKTDKLP